MGEPLDLEELLEEAGEAVLELVFEALRFVREACRGGCAREACERVEDLLGEAMDEAEEAAHGLGFVRLSAVGRAAAVLEAEAGRLEGAGCREEAELFREAARRLSMAYQLG